MLRQPAADPPLGGDGAVLFKHLPEQFLIKAGQLALGMIEDIHFILGQLGKVVEHIDQQKFGRYLRRFGEAMLDPKIIGTVAELELAVAFVVIDHGLVVELGGAQPQRVIDAGIEAQKVLVAQECREQILFIGRHVTEHIFFGLEVEPLRQLAQRAGAYQPLQFAVDTVRIGKQILTAIHLAGTHVPTQKIAAWNRRSKTGHDYFLIEDSCNHTPD